LLITGVHDSYHFRSLHHSTSLLILLFIARPVPFNDVKVPEIRANFYRSHKAQHQSTTQKQPLNIKRQSKT